MSRYRIPKARLRVETRVSNSRFIATTAPAATVREAQDFVRRMRSEMPDATHHVYAFKVGYGASVSEGMSDDGEPAGTAGPPVLAVVRGADVGDIVVVITRYFGGTKLGTGGLVSAYGASAKAAFAQLETEEKVDRHPYDLSVPYAVHAPIRTLLTSRACLIEAETFGAAVQMRVLIPDEELADIARAVHDASAGQVTPRPAEDE